MGPWSLHDFRQVAYWRTVEHSLHYTYRSKLVKSVRGQKELFATSPAEVSRKLEQLDPAQVLKKPNIDRMFQDEVFARFLGRLFRSSAILNWLDLQGAWTFTLFPGTRWGRYYTINIGPHEVALATVEKGSELPVHMIHTDRLIRDFSQVERWVKKRSGRFYNSNYARGLHHSTSVRFSGNFDQALEFLRLPGVRRAIIAYWTEALIRLQERQSGSVYARYHNWNAVAELNRRIQTATI